MNRSLLLGLLVILGFATIAPALLAQAKVASQPEPSVKKDEKPVPIDLLKIAHPEKHTVKGKWDFQGKDLVSGAGDHCVLEIPHAVPEEYTLKLGVVRKSGDDTLAIGLVVGDRRCLVVLDAGPKIGYISGLEMIDGKHCGNNETTRKGPVFKNDVSSEVLCTVKRHGISVTVDGRSVIDFRGAADRLSLGDFWKTPTDRTLFVGAQNRTIYQFSLMELTPFCSKHERVAETDPKELRRLPVQPDTPGRLAVSPDGKLLACGGFGMDHNVYLYALPDGNSVHVLKGHADSIIGVIFSADSKALLTASRDGTVREWDVKTGHANQTIVKATIMGGVGIVADHDKYPNATISQILPGKAAAIDGRLKVGDRLTAVSGRDGKMVRATDVSWEQFRALLGGEIDSMVKVEVVPVGEQKPRSYEIRRTLLLVLNQVLAMSLSTDGKTLAVASMHQIPGPKTVPLVRILDATSGKERLAFQTNTGELWGLAFSPDGKLLASAGHKVAKVWEVASGKELAELRGHKMVVCSASFSPDGKTLVTVGTDKSVKMWKVPSWEEMPALTNQSVVETIHMTPVAFSPDGRFLAVGGLGKTVQVWNILTGKKMTINAPTDQGSGIPHLAFSPDSSLLAFGSSWDRRVHIWGWEQPGSVAAKVAHREKPEIVTGQKALDVKSNYKTGIVGTWKSKVVRLYFDDKAGAFMERDGIIDVYSYKVDDKGIITIMELFNKNNAITLTIRSVDRNSMTVEIMGKTISLEREK